MERNTGKGMTEPHKPYEQLQYGSVEPRNEGLGSANQRFFQDPSNSVNTNARPPDYNIPVGARPVLNFSIQTGEEFEFMRMNSRQQHFIPNPSDDSKTATNYTELKGVLGLSHAGSESGSDFSTISPLEKGRIQESERRGTFVTEDKENYQSMQSVPHTSSRNESRKGSHGFTSSELVSDDSSTKVKILCSFGGKILPRPSDGKLRYVGGETRILRISKGITWEELMQKAVTIYNQAHIIKYQLPGEDLDALVSVSCDEDLQNMMEECNVLEHGGSQKLRMFLFSSSDLDDSQMDLGSVEGDSEIQYVVAVNGMDLGSRMNSIGLGSSSGNNLDELLNLNVEREAEREAGKPVAVVPSALTARMPSTNISAQPVVPTTSSAYETNSQTYHNQMVDHAGELHTLPSLRPSTVPSSIPLQYGNVNYPSTYAPVVENLVRTPLHGHMTGKEGPGQRPVEKLPSSTKEEKVKRDSLVELEKNRTLEKEVLVKEAKIQRDSSFQKMGEPGKTLTLEKEHTVSSHPHDSSVPKITADMGAFLLPAENHKKHDDPVHNAFSSGAINEENSNKSGDNVHINASGKPFAPGYGEFKVDSAELSHLEQQVLPQRVFHSERIPREQAELNRLSKSDDSFDPQVLLSHARSDLSQQIVESEDKLNDRTIASQLEQSVSSLKPPFMNRTVEDRPTQSRKYHEAAGYGDKISSTIPEEGSESKFLNPGLKPLLHTPVNGHESARVVNSYLYPSDIDKETSAIKNLVVSRAPSGKLLENSASRSQVSDRGDTESCAQGDNPVRAPSLVESASIGTPEQGDILIDINDRFPPDFLSDVFSKARNAEDVVGINPLHGDGTGLSLNMENHEPKRWSFFQKLVQSDSHRNDVSLMDQDHLGFSPTNKENGAPIDYSFPPLRNEGAALGRMDVDYEANFQPPSSSAVGPTSMTLHPENSQFSGNQGSQFEGLVNPKSPESDIKDGKVVVPIAPLVDLSPDEVDLSTLQIIKNEDLEELRELGSGTFGTVYHGKWRGTDVAIKRIKKSCFTGRSSEQERLHSVTRETYIISCSFTASSVDYKFAGMNSASDPRIEILMPILLLPHLIASIYLQAAEFWHEADILSKLHHPNVVAFYGVVQDGPGGTLATVTEYMVNGSLRHVLVSKDRQLDRRKRLIIAMDAAFGMEYLHSKNIVHFDLKCDNLLVNLKDPSRPICKVGDFGLSKIKRNTLVTGGVRGTLPWMAPELLNGSSSKVSEKVDVFSFGIVLWEILTGEEPYANMHYGAIIGMFICSLLPPSFPFLFICLLN
ncbi:hypothetical protein RHSIM_Rhsim13G0170400 [Rhododendron simsii]|uniref:Protein kinase domain-containing protein n=1 Tax=Rhododendron simsii TaxID=118357 RepID=A0A834FY60_RHOSS|nr:hypothetical protein RHSIM_Rhsim13G0170400 [Rhododendron simsii]